MSLSHGDIVAEIMTRAVSRGILSHYCLRSQFCLGNSGLPDLILAGRHGAAWIEVKTAGDTLSPGQTTWRHTLLAAGHEAYVIREADLGDGTLDGLLDRLAGASPEEYSH